MISVWHYRISKVDNFEEIYRSVLTPYFHGDIQPLREHIENHKVYELDTVAHTHLKNWRSLSDKTLYTFFMAAIFRPADRPVTYLRNDFWAFGSWLESFIDDLQAGKVDSMSKANQTTCADILTAISPERGNLPVIRNDSLCFSGYLSRENVATLRKLLPSQPKSEDKPPYPGGLSDLNGALEAAATQNRELTLEFVL